MKHKLEIYKPKEIKAFSIFLEGLVIPKPRPQVANKTARLPADYRRWKKEAKAELAMQCMDYPTIYTAKLILIFHGDHDGDADNLPGAVYDAMVQARILYDDDLKKNLPNTQIIWLAADRPRLEIIIEPWLFVKSPPEVYNAHQIKNIKPESLVFPQ